MNCPLPTPCGAEQMQFLRSSVVKVRPGWIPPPPGSGFAAGQRHKRWPNAKPGRNAGQTKAGPPQRTGMRSFSTVSARLGSLPSYCRVPPICPFGPGPGGGAEEIRTPDLRRAKAALSQLSYGPSRDLNSQYATASRLPASLLASRFQDGWWAILDSNQRPQSYQDCALTS